MANQETVTEVVDGDSFKTKEREVEIRLAEVYAPEADEPGGTAATRELRDLIDGEVVSVDKVGTSYGRDVAEVKIGTKSVNQHMRTYLGQ